MLRYFFTVILLLASVPAPAQETPEALRNFNDYSDILPSDSLGHERVTRKITIKEDIIPRIKKSLTDSAIYNLTHAEQVFCYRINHRPKEFNGYTIDNYAIVGYCGELDSDNYSPIYEALLTRGPNILSDINDVPHSPRFILRFARGIDYTDIMLSSAEEGSYFIIFYGGRIARFFIKQSIAEEIIKKLDKTNKDFHSPTLLKQTVANGKPTTTDEQEKLDKQRKNETPVMNWKREEKTESTPKKQLGGWGQNFKIKK